MQSRHIQEIRRAHPCGDGDGLLVIRGEPLREPVAQYGPFVMNTIEEIEQTLRDYQPGQLP